MTSIHRTVLLNEVIEGLNLNPKSVVVDGTFGGGGHSLEICKRYKGVKIIAIDQDANTWRNAKDKFERLNCDITFVNANFRDLDNLKDSLNLSNFPVDGIILDLGLSSDQLEHSDRGFSFLIDEPLLMTMKANPSSEDLTASDIVNTWGEENLAKIFFGYGQERFAKKIARGIVEARKKKKIETTFDLVKVIEDAVLGIYKKGHAKGRASRLPRKLHCATKTFQALRIAVNDELGALAMGLKKGFDVLKKGGRMSVISFHSLEDRIVKRFYKQKEKEGEAKIIPARNEFHSGGNKKVILASENEVKSNPRARSAKLRIISRL